jgi:anaerobic selenocysteine-containing dehydrogenase
VEIDNINVDGLNKPRLDMAGSKRYPFTHSLIHNLIGAITQSAQSPVDTLLIFSANPAYTLPDSGAFRRALKKIPYVVSFSPYKDESSYWADLILPDHTYLEKMEDIVWPPGLQYPLYGLSSPIVEPLYDTRNSGDVIIQLAKMVGGAVASSFPWKGFEEALKARAQGLFDSEGGLTRYRVSKPVWKDFASSKEVKPDYKSFDDMWKKLKSGGLWYRPSHHFGNWDNIFKTPTGKFEFFSKELERAVSDLAKESSIEFALKEMGISVAGDEAFLPHYEPSLSGSGKKEIMVPYELINLPNGWAPPPPYIYKTLFDHQLRKNESFVEINPETASKYYLKEGDRILIKSVKGELNARVHLFEGAMPGVIYLPMGFGHTAYDDFRQGKGVNPNEIIDGGKDPLSGHPIWWTTNVKIVKL